MAWISLSEDDLLQNLNTAEVEDYRKQVTDTQADPIAGILADVTNEVRGYVSARVPIGDKTGIPSALKNAAVDLAIYRLAKRCSLVTEAQRKTAADDAVALLRRVAEGKTGLDLETEAGASGHWGSKTTIFP